MMAGLGQSCSVKAEGTLPRAFIALLMAPLIGIVAVYTGLFHLESEERKILTWHHLYGLGVILDSKDELDSGKALAVAAAAAAPVHRSRLLAGVLGLLAPLAVAVAGWWFLRSRATPVMRYEMERLTFDGATAFTPDGKLAGTATAVLHLHSGNGVIGRMTSIGVTTDRLFLLLGELKDDVWAINLER